MSTPPPRAGQTAGDVTGRPQGRDRAAPGPYGSAQPPAAGTGRQPGSHRAQPPGRPPGDGQGTGRPGVENVNIVRSSGVMALGTLASRLAALTGVRPTTSGCSPWPRWRWPR